MIRSDYKILVKKLAALGEGPVFDIEKNRLLWTDFTKSRVYIYDIATGENKVCNTGIGISSVFLGNGCLYLAGAGGIYRSDEEFENMTEVIIPESLKGDYFNDGKCDCMGRIWTGTVDRSKTGSGALYAYDGSSLIPRVSGVNLSNGLCFNADNTVLYYIDTPVSAIFAFDYDKDTGNVGNRRIAVETAFPMPDGMTSDRDGMLWVAHWGCGCVARYNPKTGALLGTIELPAKNITCPVFGGRDLDILYVTSACNSKGGDDDCGGSLFEIITETQGYLPYKAADFN